MRGAPTLVPPATTQPPAWVEKVETPGCLVLTVEKELLHAVKCP